MELQLLGICNVLCEIYSLARVWLALTLTSQLSNSNLMLADNRRTGQCTATAYEGYQHDSAPLGACMERAVSSY